MKLNEVLDSKVDYTVNARDNRFNTIFKKGDIKVEFYATAVDDSEYWEVYFIGFDGDKHTGTFSIINSKGLEFQIMSFVKKSFIEFIERYSPLEVKFTSDKSDKARSSLYARMLKSSASKAGYDFELDTDSNFNTIAGNTDDLFVMTKK